jgi:MFS family permease
MKPRDFTILWLATLGFWSAVAAQATIFPLLMDAAGFNAGWIGLITGSAALGGLIGRPVMGWAVDRWGTRPFLVLGGAIWFITGPLVAQVSDPILLLVLRMIAGFGGAMFTAAALGYVGFVTPFERRGRVISWWDTSGSAANLIAPIGSAALILVGGFLPALWAAGGAGLFALVLGALLPHVVPGQASETGKIPFRMFSRSAIVPGLFTLATGVAAGGVIVIGPLVAERLGLRNVGVFIAMFSVGTLAVRPFSAPLSDRRGRAWVILPGFLFMAVALFMLGAFNGPWLGYTSPFLFGFGMGAVVPGLMALSIDGSPKEERGTAGNTFYAFWELGIFLGAYAQGLLLDRAGLAGYLVTAGVIAVTVMLFGVYARFQAHTRPGILIIGQ